MAALSPDSIATSNSCNALSNFALPSSSIRSAASSAASSSREQRTSNTSLKSFSVILATSAPFLGIITTSPSSSSLRIASRTGVLLTPNLLASAISFRRSPGANSPVMIACLSVLNTTSLSGRYSFIFTFNLSLIVSSPPAFSNVSSILFCSVFLP